MPALNELLEANQRFAEGFEKGNLPMPPARRVALLTCMDARLQPEKFLGLDIGDAHTIRNAEGLDAIGSLIISSKLLVDAPALVSEARTCSAPPPNPADRLRGDRTLRDSLYPSKGAVPQRGELSHRCVLVSGLRLSMCMRSSKCPIHTSALPFLPTPG